MQIMGLIPATIVAIWKVGFV